MIDFTIFFNLTTVIEIYQKTHFFFKLQ